MDNSEGLCGYAAAFAAGLQVASGELTACDQRKHQLYIAPIGREQSRFAVQRRITPSSCVPGHTYVTQSLQVASRGGARLSQNHAELRFRRHAFVAHCVLAPCFRHATSRWTAVADHVKARARLCVPRPRRSPLPSKSQRAFGACSEPPARRQRVAPPRCGCVWTGRRGCKRRFVSTLRCRNHPSATPGQPSLISHERAPASRIWVIREAGAHARRVAPPAGALTSGNATPRRSKPRPLGRGRRRSGPRGGRGSREPARGRAHRKARPPRSGRSRRSPRAGRASRAR